MHEKLPQKMQQKWLEVDRKGASPDGQGPEDEGRKEGSNLEVGGWQDVGVEVAAG